MSTTTFLVAFVVMYAVVTASELFFQHIDRTYDWNLMAWLSGTSDSPLPVNKTNNGEHPSEIDTLRERIECLETIVTEPAYELNQKINQLR